MRRAPVLLALTLAGCGDDFLPPSVLADLRVLAVAATPLEAGPGEQVALRPFVHVPRGERLVESRWSFCPLHLGSSAGFRCISSACESPLALEADGSASADPMTLALACVTQLGQATGAPVPAPGTLGTTVEGLFRGAYRSSSGVTRDAVLRFTLWPGGAPAARNRPPRISAVSLGGQALEAGGRAREVRPDEALALRVEVDPSSLDRFVDEAGRDRTEEPLLSFYATAGRFEADRLAGASTENEWRAEELEAGATESWIYVVARDQRGGQTVAGPYTVPIRR